MGRKRKQSQHDLTKEQPAPKKPRKGLPKTTTSGQDEQPLTSEQAAPKKPRKGLSETTASGQDEQPLTSEQPAPSKGKEDAAKNKKAAKSVKWTDNLAKVDAFLSLYDEACLKIENQTEGKKNLKSSAWAVLTGKLNDKFPDEAVPFEKRHLTSKWATLKAKYKVVTYCCTRFRRYVNTIL
jgi:hypothetical protein